MSHKWSNYVLKILWLIGLVVLLRGAYHFQVVANHIVNTTYNLGPGLWTSTCLRIVLGAYLAILTIKKWTLGANISLLLCVCLPTLVASLYFPLSVSFIRMAPIQLLTWLNYLGFDYFVSVVAGFTLIRGLFSASTGA